MKHLVDAGNATQYISHETWASCQPCRTPDGIRDSPHAPPDALCNPPLADRLQMPRLVRIAAQAAPGYRLFTSERASTPPWHARDEKRVRVV